MAVSWCNNTRAKKICYSFLQQQQLFNWEQKIWSERNGPAQWRTKQMSKQKLHYFHAFGLTPATLLLLLLLCVFSLHLHLLRAKSDSCDSCCCFYHFAWTIMTWSNGRFASLCFALKFTHLYRFVHPHYYNIYQSNRFQFFLSSYIRKMNFWFFLVASIVSIYVIHFISSCFSTLIPCVFRCETEANLYAKLCNRIALSDWIKKKMEERDKENVLSHPNHEKLFKSHPCKMNSLNLRSFAHSVTLWHRVRIYSCVDIGLRSVKRVLPVHAHLK